MQLVEFLILLVLFLVFFLPSIFRAKRARKQAEEAEKEEEPYDKQYYQILEKQRRAKERAGAPPKPPISPPSLQKEPTATPIRNQQPPKKQILPIGSKQLGFDPALQERFLHSKLEEREVSSKVGKRSGDDLISMGLSKRLEEDVSYRHITKKSSYAKKLIQSGSLKDMIIMREILTPPWERDD